MYKINVNILLQITQGKTREINNHSVHIIRNQMPEERKTVQSQQKLSTIF